MLIVTRRDNPKQRWTVLRAASAMLTRRLGDGTLLLGGCRDDERRVYEHLHRARMTAAAAPAARQRASRGSPRAGGGGRRTPMRWATVRCWRQRRSCSRCWRRASARPTTCPPAPRPLPPRRRVGRRARQRVRGAQAFVLSALGAVAAAEGTRVGARPRRACWSGRWSATCRKCAATSTRPSSPPSRPSGGARRWPPPSARTARCSRGGAQLGAPRAAERA